MEKLGTNKLNMQKLLAPAALVILYIVFSIFGNNFLSLDMVKNILESSYYIGFMAFGVTFVIITGGIDLSLGTAMMCAALLGGFSFKQGCPLILSVFLTILVGVVFGFANGIFVAKLKLPPFIATLGTMQIFRSVTQHLTQHANPSVPKGFLQIANLKIGSFYIMPILYWLAIAAVLYVVSKRTTFGRHVFAVGSNIRTARLSGINVNKVKRRIYMLTGMLVAIAAIIQVSRIGSMDYASAGSGYEMDAIAAVIVGGTSMSGGKGSIVGTVLGMLIIGVMNNLLTLFGVPPFLREACKGVIVIVAVLLQKKEADA